MHRGESIIVTTTAMKKSEKLVASLRADIVRKRKRRKKCFAND